jgi:hypothetical protein
MTYERSGDPKFLGSSRVLQEIEGLSALSGPLTALTRKNAPYVWNKDCEASFQELK